MKLLTVWIIGVAIAVGTSGITSSAGAPATTPSVYDAEPTPADQARVTKIIANLGSNDFATRDAADKDLQRLPVRAFPLVQAALKRSDIDVETRTRLEGYADGQTKRYDRWAAENDLHKAEFDWNMQDLLSAYDKSGRHDSKWDETAQTLIRLYVTPIPPGRAAQAEHNSELRVASKKLVTLRCDDPIVFYVRAGLAKRKGADADAQALYRQAAKNIGDTTYSACRKMFVYERFAAAALEDADPNEMAEQQTEIVAAIRQSEQLMPEAFNELKSIPRFVGDLAAMHLASAQRFEADRAKAAKPIIEALKQTFPNDPMPLVFEGKMLTQYAWDARGGGYANTVTEDGWKLMRQRLAQAEEQLTKAWKLNPDRPEAATAMITVELGQGKGRAVMEQWFDRAISADPDYLEAYTAKLYYLEPKWYGNEAEMLTFARKCARDGYVGSQVPFILVSAHESLSAYAESRRAYYAQPAVWQDLKMIYERMLDGIDPGSRADSIRTAYARWAVICKQRPVAAEQFRLLGDRVDSSVFTDWAEFDSMRKWANIPERAATTHPATQPIAVH